MNEERIIVELPNDEYLCFDRKRIDEWCVYKRSHKSNFETVPLDKDYFNTLLQLGKNHGEELALKSFLHLYALLSDVYTDNISERDRKYIRNLAKRFAEDEDIAFENFCTLYAAMIAEHWRFLDPNNKASLSVLGKEIKKVGVCSMFLDGVTPFSASERLKNAKARDIMSQSIEQNEKLKSKGIYLDKRRREYNRDLYKKRAALRAS